MQPTSVGWDGRRVLISTKAGYVSSFDTVGGWVSATAKAGGSQSSDAVPLVLDISAEVADYADHGLIGMTYSGGYLWLAYTRRTEGPYTNVGCTDFGSFDGRVASEIYGCLAYSRYSRVPYDAAQGIVTGLEEVIIDGGTRVDNGAGDTMPLLCGQFATHGATAAVAGLDGTIYFAAGDGASYQAPDVGEFPNICEVIIEVSGRPGSERAGEGRRGGVWRGWGVRRPI